MGKIDLRTMIDPDPCNAAQERANWGRLRLLLGWLEQAIEVNIDDDDDTTITITFRPDITYVTNLYVTNVYQQPGGVELCLSACPTAAATYVAPMADDYYDWELKLMMEAERRAKRRQFDDMIVFGGTSEATEQAITGIIGGTTPP